MLFLSHIFMESSMLIGTEYDNGERKKESIKKTVKNKKLKGSKRMRIEGTGRKSFNKKLDESVLEWIRERRSKDFWVSRKLIVIKVIVMYHDMVRESESNYEFKASTGWLRTFRNVTISLCNKNHYWLKITQINWYILLYMPPSCHETSIPCF